MTFEAAELTAEQVRPLRLSVLRAGMKVQDVVWEEDAFDGVFHIGVVDDGRVVAISTWIPQPAPAVFAAAEPSMHLRGMATDPDHRGAGLGGIVLEAGCRAAAERGFASVWANGRDAALDFYRRHGFTVVGPGFVDPLTELPHHRIYRRLTDRDRRGGRLSPGPGNPGPGSSSSQAPIRESR